MKRTVSITNKKVNDILDEAKKENRASKLIEEAVLFYYENIEEGRISRETVKDIVLDCLKGMVTTVSGPISNGNYVENIEIIDDDIDFIRGLGE